jgi:N-(2-amino-2-carboxyethyl)-L-glutamate synthase
MVERLGLVEKLIRETPIVALEDDRVELYAKLEYMNGVGSIKDRPAFWILKRAIERGDVAPGTCIVESSSGNFACALATYCALLGLEFIPVIDPNVSAVYEAFLRAHCQRVVKVEQRDDTGGFLKTRIATVRALLGSMPHAYWTNQYENLDGVAAHYELTAGEICRALPDLDYVFLGVSSAGTLAGVSQRLKQHRPAVKVIAVDVEGSMAFQQIPKARTISGIGSSIQPPLIARAIVDDVCIVSESATIAACQELLARHGLFVGGSTGSAYSAIQTYFGARPSESRRPKVLFLCCDRGTAYVHNVFNKVANANV